MVDAVFYQGLKKVAYAFAMLWCDDDCEVDVSLAFKSPTFLFVNGKLQCRSQIEEERFRNVPGILKISLARGGTASS